jgi:hypothetical protein
MRMAWSNSCDGNFIRPNFLQMVDIIIREILISDTEIQQQRLTLHHALVNYHYYPHHLLNMMRLSYIVISYHIIDILSHKFIPLTSFFAIVHCTRRCMSDSMIISDSHLFG